MPDRTPIDSGDLWRWVDRLTNDRRQRLVRQKPGQRATVEWVPVPSLWTQLGEAVGSTTTSDGGQSKSTGSPAPIDVAITALMHEMSTTLLRALRDAGLRPRGLRPVIPQPAARPTPVLVDVEPDLAGRLAERAARAAADTAARRDSGRLRHDVRSDLRQLASHLVTHVRDQHLVDQWADRYRSWVARAEDALTLDGDRIDTRGIRGHACPACAADHVQRIEDGETYRDPALVVAFPDGQVLHATCRACSTGWWGGDDLDELAAALQAGRRPPQA